MSVEDLTDDEKAIVHLVRRARGDGDNIKESNAILAVAMYAQIPVGDVHAAMDKWRNQPND